MIIQIVYHKSSADTIFSPTKQIVGVNFAGNERLLFPLNKGVKDKCLSVRKEIYCASYKRQTTFNQQ